MSAFSLFPNNSNSNFNPGQCTSFFNPQNNGFAQQQPTLPLFSKPNQTQITPSQGFQLFPTQQQQQQPTQQQHQQQPMQQQPTWGVSQPQNNIFGQAQTNGNATYPQPLFGQTQPQFNFGLQQQQPPANATSNFAAPAVGNSFPQASNFASNQFGQPLNALFSQPQQQHQQNGIFASNPSQPAVLQQTNGIFASNPSQPAVLQQTNGIFASNPSQPAVLQQNNGLFSSSIPQQPQQQCFNFAPANQPIQPQQFYQNYPQQYVLVHNLDQNGQVTAVPMAINVPHAQYNSQPSAFYNNNVSNTQTGWGTTGMIPAEMLNSAVIGRGPSLFSTDPAFDSPLYTWKRNTTNWRRMADGLNPSIASTFVDPPGLWTLPSAPSYFPRPQPIYDYQAMTDKSRNMSPPSLFEERDFAFQHWNNALKKSPVSESPKHNPFLRNTENYRRFKLAYENDDLFGKYPTGAFSSPLSRDNEGPKRLNPQLVRSLEGLAEPKKKYTLNNPTFKLGQESARSYDSRFYKPLIELVNSSYKKEPPVSPRPVGLFDQPSPGKIPSFLKSPTLGPPKDNSFDFCDNDPWRARQNIYNKLVNDSRNEQYATRLPKLIHPLDSPQSFPPNKTRIWSDGLEDHATIRTPPRTPPPRGPPPANRSGVTLSRPDYYCIPDITSLDMMVDLRGQCLVQDFEVGHNTHGAVVFPGITNVMGLNLDKIINFSYKSVDLYPNGKPPYGHELNRPATVTLYGVWPVLKETDAIIQDPEMIMQLRYENLLRNSCQRFRGKFISYDSLNGVWVFEIQNS